MSVKATVEDTILFRLIRASVQLASKVFCLACGWLDLVTGSSFTKLVGTVTGATVFAKQPTVDVFRSRTQSLQLCF